MSKAALQPMNCADCSIRRSRIALLSPRVRQGNGGTLIVSFFLQHRKKHLASLSLVCHMNGAISPNVTFFLGSLGSQSAFILSNFKCPNFHLCPSLCAVVPSLWPVSQSGWRSVSIEEKPRESPLSSPCSPST